MLASGHSPAQICIVAAPVSVLGIGGFQKRSGDANAMSEIDDERMELTLEELRDEDPNTFREMLLRLLDVLYYVVDRVPDSPEKWGIAFGCSAPICLGKSMSETAAKYGWSRAMISYEARRFCDHTGLPPSTYMKSDCAILSAKKSRIKAVKNIEKKQNERRTENGTGRADRPLA